MLNLNTFFFQKAIEEAKIASKKGEVPVGAVIVCQDQIIGKGHNQVELLHDITAHAEIIAITAASNFLNNKFLDDCTLYVTLEPCLMCIGAIKHARIKTIVFGAFEQKKMYEYKIEEILNKTEIIGGFMQAESEQLLKDFFAKRR
ncbi:MAG: nucleoside deaminase [Chitinophagales bacterium]|jgi:tRNA(adenine34) deaminase|nr:nucleoside deaminase [Bacteroidota bacterium]MBP7257358.1 nucleoside deaminase [Chitinophagales bacterium]